MTAPATALRTPLLTLLAAACLLLPATASATVTASSITAPAGPGATLYPVLTDANTTVTVSGLASGTGDVRIYCAFTDGAAIADPAVALGVPLVGDAFSSPVELNQLTYRPCSLRAYPSPGAIPADPTPFTGPLVLAQENSLNKRQTGANAGLLRDFHYVFGQTRSVSEFYSLASCGLCGMAWVDTTSPRPLRASNTWNAAAAFFGFLDPAKTKTDATIDGHKVIWPDDVGTPTAFKDYANHPAITSSVTAADGVVTPSFTESTEPARCPDDAWTVLGGLECPSFTKLGVRLDRAVTNSADGRTWNIEDRYTSVDGQQHDLDLQYASYMNSGGAGGGGMSVPWSPTPGFVTVGGMPSTWSFDAPATLPASMFVDNGLGAPDGDPTAAAGSLTVGPGFVGGSVAQFNPEEILTRFKRTVPAGGTTSVRMAYSATPTQAEARAAAAAAEDLIRGPAPVTPPAPGPPTPAGPAADVTVPVVTGAKLAPAALRSGAKGTAFSFGSSEAGTAKLVLSRKVAGKRKGRACVKPTRALRRARSCTRLVKVKTITKAVTAGATTITISARTLAPGSYSATLTVTDAAGNAAQPVTKTFTVTRRRP